VVATIIRTKAGAGSEKSHPIAAEETMPMIEDDDAVNGTFASPPCSLHELDPAYAGLVVDPIRTSDVARWRKAERERLIATRLAVSASERTECAMRIGQQLDRLIPSSPSTILSLYWPFKGELDLRPWMASAIARGIRVALPVVVAKATPLIFREWTPDARMERGVWNILFPADGVLVTPTHVIAPLVGFDPQGYRLGYGGGFFDRTLASLNSKPIAIGVAHPSAAIPTIYPQSHDIPMDWILTGDCASKRRQL
jgi:5,10-methenyltetrahydrofolate synthetase